MRGWRGAEERRMLSRWERGARPVRRKEWKKKIEHYRENGKIIIGMEIGKTLTLARDILSVATGERETITRDMACALVVVGSVVISRKIAENAAAAPQRFTAPSIGPYSRNIWVPLFRFRKAKKKMIKTVFPSPRGGGSDARVLTRQKNALPGRWVAPPPCGSMTRHPHPPTGVSMLFFFLLGGQPAYHTHQWKTRKK